MKVINNLVIPEEGNFLKHSYSDNLYKELALGKSKYYINGKNKMLDLDLKDISEVKEIEIDGKTYKVILSNDYGTMVTNLIRLKFTLDKELALMANARLGKNPYEEQEFQEWRDLCKDIAKKLLNE